MLYMLKFKNNHKYNLIISILILLFSVNFVSAKSAPESFADLAQKLSPSVVNISTTTVIDQKSRDLPSFPPGSPFEDFFKQFDKPGNKKRRAQSLGSGSQEAAGSDGPSDLCFCSKNGKLLPWEEYYYLDGGDIKSKKGRVCSAKGQNCTYKN